MEKVRPSRVNLAAVLANPSMVNVPQMMRTNITDWYQKLEKIEKECSDVAKGKSTELPGEASSIKDMVVCGFVCVYIQS